MCIYDAAADNLILLHPKDNLTATPVTNVSIYDTHLVFVVPLLQERALKMLLACINHNGGMRPHCAKHLTCHVMPQH